MRSSQLHRIRSVSILILAALVTSEALATDDDIDKMQALLRKQAEDRFEYRRPVLRSLPALSLFDAEMFGFDGETVLSEQKLEAFQRDCAQMLRGRIEQMKLKIDESNSFRDRSGNRTPDKGFDPKKTSIGRHYILQFRFSERKDGGSNITGMWHLELREVAVLQRNPKFALVVTSWECFDSLSSTRGAFASESKNVIERLLDVFEREYRRANESKPTRK